MSIQAMLKLAIGQSGASSSPDCPGATGDRSRFEVEGIFRGMVDLLCNGRADTGIALSRRTARLLYFGFGGSPAA
jgi:hypothetical protein